MIKIKDEILIGKDELSFTFSRSSKPGGQNVNKVSSAVHLRFDIHRSTLPEFYKQRLLAFKDSRINKDGVIVIKAQQYRSQDKNKQAALERLKELILKATHTQKSRRPSKPSRNARKKRMDVKSQRGKTKAMRQKPSGD